MRPRSIISQSRRLTTLVTAAALILHLLLDGICADPCDVQHPVALGRVCVHDSHCSPLADQSCPHEHSAPHEGHTIGDCQFTTSQQRTTVDRDNAAVDVVDVTAPAASSVMFVTAADRHEGPERSSPLGLHLLYRALRI